MSETRGKILIVDDEEVVRDSLNEWFAAEGYETKPIACGKDALTAITMDEYDDALLDIRMPGMDGMELQQRLHAADPQLTVIIMTGYATVETGGPGAEVRGLRLHH